ncbi:uncharacterized protein LOC144614945 isoform X1 [Panthera onca]
MSSSTQTVGYMRMETPAGLSHRCALVSGTSLACEGLSECAPETTSKAPVTIVPPPGVSSRGPARCGVPLPPGNLSTQRFSGSRDVLPGSQRSPCVSESVVNGSHLAGLMVLMMLVPTEVKRLRFENMLELQKAGMRLQERAGL